MIDAMNQALEALKRLNDIDGVYSWESTEQALRQAIEQAEKQDTKSLFKFMANNKEVLRLDEQGLHYKGDAVHDAGIAYRLFVEWMKESTLQEISDIGQEIEQEPVAYRKEAHGMWFYIENKPSPPNYDYEPLYTEPPKREWVGLAWEEIRDIWIANYHDTDATDAFAYAIEAKLRERNT